MVLINFGFPRRALSLFKYVTNSAAFNDVKWAYETGGRAVVLLKRDYRKPWKLGQMLEAVVHPPPPPSTPPESISPVRLYCPTQTTCKQCQIICLSLRVSFLVNVLLTRSGLLQFRMALIFQFLSLASVHARGSAFGMLNNLQRLYPQHLLFTCFVTCRRLGTH